MNSRLVAEQEFLELLKRKKITDQYKMLWKSSPNNMADQITVLNPKSGARASYSAGHPPESPKYWLHRLGRALADGTFGL